MLKQPIYYEFNLDARTSPSKLIAISHVDDKYSEVLEVAVKQNDRFVYMGGATVVARVTPRMRRVSRNQQSSRT